MATRRKFDFKFKETVLKYAEENSAEKTARLFNIDSKRVRDWRKQKEALLRGDQGRARLAGGGRKKVSVELEERLSEWIGSMRDKRRRVSRSMIKKKALEIYSSVSDGGKTFVASTGWLQKFLERNDLSHRRRTAAPQEDPNLLTDRLVWFIDYVGKTVSSRRILERDIIMMDETAICFGDTAPPTADTQGVEGHKSSSLTAILAAKADGAKLKPFIVFRGADGGVEVAQQELPGAVIDMSVDGGMSDALTARWLRSVVGKSNSTLRLLVWDSHRCHVGPATKAELECGYDITMATIPRGCAQYVQPSDLTWKQPFRQNVLDAYKQWAAGDVEEHTPGGSLNPPARRLLVDWVVAAWDKVDMDTIKNSFNVCGQDGSEDRLIVCVREGRRRVAGREELSESGEPRAAPKDVNNELCLDEDEEEGEEEGEGPAHSCM